MSVMLVLGTALPAMAQTDASDPIPVPIPQWVRPPPINVDFLQYGVAFAGEFKLSAGAVCPKNATTPCILGSGVGLVARAGYRSSGPWYVGGAYEFVRLDTNSLMRLGVLQQLRGEGRYVVDLGQRTAPYVSAGVGGVVMGNEWGVESGGVSASWGLGFETQITRTTVVGAAFVHRPILFFGWVDGTGQARGTGITHFAGLEVILEAREPLNVQ